MFARLILAASFAALVASPAPAQPPRKDATADVLAKLRLPCDLKPGELSLEQFAEEISKVTGVPVLVNENALNGAGAAALEQIALREGGPTIKVPKMKGLPASVVLRHCLSPVQATYLVRKSYIEIVSVSAAIRETKNDPPEELADGTTMRSPLVSAIFKEKPLNEAIADLADDFEVTVVVSPQAGDNKAGFVNARLLNVPADDALELLAAQADLRVVRQGKAFLITSPDHANQIFDEKIARQTKQAELERLRVPFGLGGGLGGPAPNPDR